MKKSNYNDGITDQLNAEYVVLQTTSLSMGNKSSAGKLDSLALLLEESESVTNFRRYLDSINSGHFLDFWFACQGFKNFDKSDSHKLKQLMKVIYKAYIRSESPFAVPLISNTKKSIIDKLSDRKIFDPTIFDAAQLEIRDILAGEFLNKFFKSEFYTDTNIFDKGSHSSVHNNQQLNDVSVSSCSSTGFISRRSAGAKNLVTSRSFDAVKDSSLNRNPKENFAGQTLSIQGTGAVSSGFNNHNFETNVGTISLKDKSNMSETDPQAFAKVLSKKLEDVFVEQTNFDRMLRLVKSVPNESDTDDSHSSAISYLLKCQWYNSQNGHCCSIDGDVATDSVALLSSASCKMKSMYYPGDVYNTDIRDDYAQGILENHCSRIGVDQNETRYTKRDISEIKSKLKRETDLGSITSYDSGVATSLEQYSNLGVPSHLLSTILQLQRDKSKNSIQLEPRSDDSRYHHHHHHHHHKNHVDYPFHKDILAVNNVSDMSSNIDSGVSSTYEHLGGRFQPTNDKVANWMSKNPKVTSKHCYNNNESFPSNVTSGIPPNTPLISSRDFSSMPSNDNYPHQSCLLSRFDPYSKTFSSLPESGIRPCQSIENWLKQQDTNHSLARISESRCHNYCSSTVGVAGSELLLREDICSKEQKCYQALVQPVLTKDQQTISQSSKLKTNGPLVIGYYVGNDPVPYRTQIPDAQHITLGQFKSLIAKKGPFRYFFKRYCDEFECGVVHEEITKDDAILPLWEGKVVAKIEKSD